MQKTKCIAALLIWGLFAASGNSAVRLHNSNLETALIKDVSDGRLDEFDELTAALIAGGISDTRELATCRDYVLDQCSIEGRQFSNVEEIEQELFHALHGQLLTGQYHVEYTSPSRAVMEGHFNCVAATILYYCLCEHHGISAAVLATREHVFVRLPGDSPRVVETTCPDWFAFGDTPRRDALQAALAISREISFVQLLGKVFYNRALSGLAEERFSEAVRLLEVSLRLDDQDEPARENLLATYNNWALFEAEKGNFRRATQLIGTGSSLDPDYPPFLANDIHIHQKWVKHLCHQHQYGIALACLQAAFQRRAHVPLFDVGRMVVYQQWAESLFDEGDDEHAYHVLQTARQQLSTDIRWHAYEAAALRHTSEHLTTSRS